MSINYPTLSAEADLAHLSHFRHLRHFRHFIRRGGFSPLLTNASSTTVEIALQIHSILTNKPNFMRFSPENDDFTKNKPNSKPIQTQTNPILGQYQGWQSQNKPKQTQFKSNNQSSLIANKLRSLPLCSECLILLSLANIKFRNKGVAK